jgi:pimeloyl-ACP methyl ester carboxylesterase
MEKIPLLLFLYLALSSDLPAQERRIDNSTDIHFTVPITTGSRGKSIWEDKSGEAAGNFDQAVLKLPCNYSKRGKPTRLIYVAHGAGGGVTADSWFLNNFALVDTLLANGYAIYDVNGGSVENMGGPTVVRSSFRAYKYIRKRYNVDKKIFVVGLSMGGLSSSNFICRHPQLVLAQGLFSAVLDLHRQAWEHPWLPTTRISIARAFDFSDKSGEVWEEDNIAGWNPVSGDRTVPGKDTIKSYPVPVKIWHGIGDRVVNISASRCFQRYIQSGEGYCELIEINSEDHGLSCGNPVINHELVLFLKRSNKFRHDGK